MELQQSNLNQTDVFLSLAKHVFSTEEPKDSNPVLSPLLINVMLGMIVARSNCPTRDQLPGFLKSKSIEELNSLLSQLVTLLFADVGPRGGPRLSFANAVWVDGNISLNPGFKQIVDKAYKAVCNH